MEWKQLIDPFLRVMAVIIGSVFLVIPLTNDARIYLGVEHIAASYYAFPQGIDLAWEIKPIANRLTNFILYKIATFFIPFDDHFLFGIAVKAVALISIIFVAWYFAREIRGKYTFFLVFFSFTAIANFCILQAEYWAALCSLLAIAMLVSDSRSAWFGSGALLIWIFLLKGITGLMAIPILCGAYLLLGWYEEYLDPLDGTVIYDGIIGRSGFLVAGCCSAVVVFLTGSFLWWPHIISDMFLSPHLARVGMVGPVNIVVWFFAQLVMSPLYIPVIFIGVVFGAIFFFAWVRRQECFTRLSFGLVWIVPALIVMIQGEMFLYHYLVFVPASIVAIVMCERMSS
jgi:hypothetical protein